VSDNARIRYEIDLSAPRMKVEGSGSETRPLGPTDRDAVARLMLDAYIGTIDYEGETIAEALDEVDSWLKGSPLLEHSYGAVVDGRLVSAVLAMTLDEAPFIRSVMTDPGHKASGLGRIVTAASLKSMESAGYQRVVFYITEGNTPSERLFSSLGAHPITDP